MMAMRSFLIAFALWAAVVSLPGSSLAAQSHSSGKPTHSSAADRGAFPIESISVEGNEVYSREQVLAVAQLKVGQAATKQDFEAAYSRLRDCGAFSSVGYHSKPAPDGKGWAVSLEVVEAGPFFSVRFEDFGVDPAQIQAALKRSDPLFGERIPGTQEVLNRYAKSIETYLATLKQNEKVLGKLMPDDSGELTAVFRPATPVPVVARVAFTNNQVVSEENLLRAINDVALGVPYREPSFRRLLESSVRPVYEQRGHVRVSFPEIKTEKAAKVDGLLVTVKVDEGASYSFGTIAVEGSGLPAAKALDLAGLKKNDVFNSGAIDAGIKKIEKRVQHEGYLDVKSAPERRYNDAAKTVDLVIRVERGPQYVFGDLTIKGLDLLSEPEIRKMWALKPGQPFNPDYPDAFLADIRGQELFDNLAETKAVIARDEKNHSADVTLIFKGGAPKGQKKRAER